MSGWVVDGVEIVSDHGAERIAGWRYGPLFLDFRPLIERTGKFDFCWMISSVPTGLAIVGLMTDLRQAQKFVEQLAGLTDWERCDGGVAPPFFRAWLDEPPCAWCMASATISPTVEVQHRPVLRVVQ